MSVTIATDTFDRADGDIGSNWTLAVGSSANKPDIQSGVIKAQATTEDEIVYWNADIFDVDQYSQITMSTIGDAKYSGPIVRANGTDWVDIEMNSTNTEMRIVQYEGALYTILGTYTGSIADGDILRLEAEGQTFRAYQNGTLRITAVYLDGPIFDYSNNITTLWPGFKITDDAGTKRMNDWEGGNLYSSLRVRGYKEGGTQASVNTQDETFYIDSVSNSVLYVVVGARDNTAADLPITSMTYNSLPLTKVRSDLFNAATYVMSEIWQLIDPPVGTNTLTINYTGICDFVRPQMYHIMENDQTTPVEASGGSDGDSTDVTSFSESVSSISINGALLFVTWTKDSTTPTPGTGLIEYGQTSPNVGDDRLQDGIRRLTAVGSYAVEYSWVGSDGYAVSIAALKPIQAIHNIGSMLAMFR